jgi:hypothetical protein
MNNYLKLILNNELGLSLIAGILKSDGPLVKLSQTTHTVLVDCICGYPWHWWLAFMACTAQHTHWHCLCHLTGIRTGSLIIGICF